MKKKSCKGVPHCSFQPEREATGNWLLPPSCAALRNGGEARMSKDAMKFPSFEYSCFFLIGNLLDYCRSLADLRSSNKVILF